MKTLIANFSKQLQEALEIGRKTNLGAPNKPIHNVLISGLGGSGIGGTIVSQLVQGEATVPINVNKDYFIPSYVNSETLVIISSYSGNTEETLSAMKNACDQQATVVCVTSGGEVLETAQKHDLPHIIIPGGMPPRACLAYSLTQLFFVLNAYGIIGDSFIQKIEAAIDLLNEEKENIQNTARNISSSLKGKIPIIYSIASNEGIGIRWRQQLNENAKMLCWHHVFPEMNHNELVGWKSATDDLAVILLRNDDDYKKTKTRIEICKGIFAKDVSTIVEVNSKGKSDIERALYLIHIGDWVSYLLSEENNVDAMEIDVINFLKSELANH